MAPAGRAPVVVRVLGGRRLVGGVLRLGVELGLFAVEAVVVVPGRRRRVGDGRGVVVGAGAGAEVGGGRAVGERLLLGRVERLVGVGRLAGALLAVGGLRAPHTAARGVHGLCRLRQAAAAAAADARVHALGGSDASTELLPAATVLGVH